MQDITQDADWTVDDGTTSRGRLGRLAGSQGKRKRVEDYSENPRTVASRNRMTGYNEYDKVLTRAKNADRKATNRALAALKSTPEYLLASASRQQALVENRKRDETAKRKVYWKMSYILSC